jgi:uncharacterized membrane protein
VTVEVDQRPPGRSRYLYPAFIASLAINLLFIGGISAAVWHHHNEEVRRASRAERGMLGFVKQLPADRQAPVREEILAARESLKDLRATVRKSWIEANNLLTAEPFDKEKFKTAMTQLRDVENQFKTALNNALADTAEKLSPDERKLLKSWRETRRPWLLRRTNKNGEEKSKPD